MALATKTVPLIVDLDGTLLRSDALLESFFAAVRLHPMVLLQIWVWLLQGLARLKQQLAVAGALDVNTLPLNQELLQFLHEQKRMGRRLILATGADQRIAAALVRRCGLFSRVMASDGMTNLRGRHKRDRLVAAWGERGFDYIGNSTQDLPVWACARHALMVNPSARLQAAVTSLTPVERIFSSARPGPAIFASAMRVHHWLKNLLVGAPLLLDHSLHDTHLLLRILLAMFCFSLAASGVYLLNDLLDLSADRRHPSKKTRVLANGSLPIGIALRLLLCLWLASAILALCLPHAFAACLGVYLMLMLGYSLCLKDIPIVDGLVLAMGYSLRMLAGALALGVGISLWLLISSSTLFFGLALLKRYAEMVATRNCRGAETHVRCYPLVHAARVALLGASAGAVAIVLLALYPLLEPTMLQPWPAWLLCALLFLWLTHLWHMARLGRIYGDPVVFAIRDPLSRLIGVLSVMVSLVAA